MNTNRHNQDSQTGSSQLPHSKQNTIQPKSLSAWQAFLDAYINPQALALLFLGFAAGVPYLLIFSSLGLWLREAGIDRATVTMFGWATLGYSFKFIWSPLIDRLPIPILGKMLGHRRSWLLLSQLLIITAIVIMALTDPTSDTAVKAMAMGAVLLGFSAATQDIVIDAYRIESAPMQMQTALSATYVTGYRLGMIVSGAGVLYLASYFGSTMEVYNYAAWQKSYLAMAAVMGVAVVTTLLIKEPQSRPKPQGLPTSDYVRLVLVFALSVIMFILAYREIGGVLPKVEGVLTSFALGALRFVSSGACALLTGYLLIQVGVMRKEVAKSMWVQPIIDFFDRYGKQAMLLLLLIGLYRISDIVAGNISNLFYQELQFTKEQIANAVKVVGVIASITGGLVGGWLAQKTGIMKAMLVGALLACLTNLLFIVLFNIPTQKMLYVAVIIDNLAAGLASAVFVAFLSALTSIRFTAVQYALFSSLMTLSPKILGGYSGAIVNEVGYANFFMITFIIGLPVLVLVWLVDKKIPISEPQIDK